MKKVRDGKSKVVVEVDGIDFTGVQLTPTELKRINEKYTKTVGSGATARQELDSMGAAFEIFNIQVDDWSGELIGISGEILVCNRETKKLLWEHDQQFCESVHVAIKDAFARRDDLSEKN